MLVRFPPFPLLLEDIQWLQLAARMFRWHSTPGMITFISHFGVSPHMANVTWAVLEHKGLVPAGHSPLQLLEALWYCKVYPSWKVAAKAVDKYPSRFCPVVIDMIFALSRLEMVCQTTTSILQHILILLLSLFFLHLFVLAGNLELPPSHGSNVHGKQCGRDLC